MAGSRKAAIDAFCKECIYDPAAEGTWRAQVADCKSTACSLFPFRPLPTTKENDES